MFWHKELIVMLPNPTIRRFCKLNLMAQDGDIDANSNGYRIWNLVYVLPKPSLFFKNKGFNLAR